MPRLEMDEDERVRDGRGCVGPVMLCVGIGSAGSTGIREGVLAALEFRDALLALDAEFCARRAESSRVRRFTYQAYVRPLDQYVALNKEH